MVFERGDKVRTHILGVDVETIILDLRDAGHSRQELLVRVPDDIIQRAGMRHPYETRRAKEMIKNGLWCYSTGVEKVI